MPAHKQLPPLLQPERLPWDRMEGEPIVWYLRFDHYRKQGPGRSVQRTYEQMVHIEAEHAPERATTGQKLRPGNWPLMYAKWLWKQRAEAFDMAELAKQDREEAKQKRQERNARRLLITGLRGKVVEAMNSLDATTMQPKDFIAAMQLVLKEGRAEWDDEPTHRVETAGTVTGTLAVTGTISNADLSEMTDEEIRTHAAAISRTAAIIAAGNPFAGAIGIDADAAGYEGAAGGDDETDDA